MRAAPAYDVQCVRYGGESVADLAAVIHLLLYVGIDPPIRVGLVYYHSPFTLLGFWPGHHRAHLIPGCKWGLVKGARHCHTICFFLEVISHMSLVVFR